MSKIGEPLPRAGACIYLDWNATTPLIPEVQAEIKRMIDEGCFGNASSGHVYGRQSAAKLTEAREAVARLVNAPSPSSIVFTSCGTESDNWAIYGSVQLAKRRGVAKPHVITSAIDHPAILKYLDELQASGELSYTAVGVNREGLIDPGAVEAAILSGETCLITVMHSNNEVGSLQPIKELASIAKKHGLLLHTDAAQSLGKVRVDVSDLDVDLCTIVGHKFGAPKGVAALYIRPSLAESFPRFLLGGGQESGKRAGTENLLLVAAMGRAAQVCHEEADRLYEHNRTLRNHLREQLEACFPEGSTRVNGPEDESLCLPNTLSFAVKGLQSSLLLSSLSDYLAASAGAACHSSAGSISSVLKAMDVPVEFARGTLRLSTGRHSTREEIGEAVDLIALAAREQGIELTEQGTARADRAASRIKPLVKL